MWRDSLRKHIEPHQVTYDIHVASSSNDVISLYNGVLSSSNDGTSSTNTKGLTPTSSTPNNIGMIGCLHTLDAYIILNLLNTLYLLQMHIFFSSLQHYGQIFSKRLQINICYYH